MLSKNPYIRHTALGCGNQQTIASNIHGRSVIAFVFWAIGTFLLSLLTGFDVLTGAQLPGALMYLSFLLGPIVAIVGAMATPYSFRGKMLLIVAAICLLPFQFVIIGILLLATTGFAEIH